MAGEKPASLSLATGLRKVNRGMGGASARLDWMYPGKRESRLRDSYTPLDKNSSLTDEAQWNIVWEKEKRLKVSWFTAWHLRQELLFRKYLPCFQGKSLLEMGCAPGRWLVYFHERLGFLVHGIDFSRIGCQISESLLDNRGIRGVIYYGDVLDRRLIERKFDTVVSFGFIEHFDDPAPVISRHVELCKPGGVVFITVPNYGVGSFYRWLARRLGSTSLQSITEGHNLKCMEKVFLKSLVSRVPNFEVIFLDYVGPIHVTIVPTAIGSKLLPMLPIHIVNQALGFSTLLLRSAIFSPHLVLVGRKSVG